MCGMKKTADHLLHLGIRHTYDINRLLSSASEPAFRRKVKIQIDLVVKMTANTLMQTYVVGESSQTKS